MLQFGANACASLISPGNNTVTWLQCGEAQFDLCLIRHFYFESYNLPSKIGWLGIRLHFRLDASDGFYWCWEAQRGAQTSLPPAAEMSIWDCCGDQWNVCDCPVQRKTVHISKSLKLSPIIKQKQNILSLLSEATFPSSCFYAQFAFLHEYISMHPMTI